MSPAKLASPRSPQSAPPTLGLVRPLVALCGNTAGKEDALLAFRRFRSLWPRVKVGLSSGAERLFRGSRRPFAGFQLTGEDPDLLEHCEASDGVILLNPSTNLVGKMASLIADCPPSIAAFTALEKGRRVWLVRRPLERSLEVPGVGMVLGEKLAVLEGFGIRVVPTWETLLADGEAGCLHAHEHGPDHVCTGDCRPGAPASQPSLADRYTGVELRPPTPGDCPTCPVPDGCQKYCPELVVPVLQAGAVRVQGGLGHVGGQDLARTIDHTLLKPEATAAQVKKLCAEAREHVFASVCVNPGFVRMAARELAGTRVKVCTVIGFPLGATSTEAKACETRQAVLDGADEIDMVVNISALKNHEDGRVEEDIRQVVRAAEGRLVKVILETALLTDEEKVRGCVLSKRAGAHFVKTSTGFSTGGATVEDIALMRRTVGPDMGVKASGGVRDLEGAQAMLRAGATRIGASASVAIVTGQGAEGQGY